MPSSQIRIVSFNMHGETDNVSKFQSYLNSEDIICLQEVDDIPGTRNQYQDYPYVFITTNETTKGWRKKNTSIMILSKVPFAGYASKLIQTDPGGDQWQRNAQYVSLKVDTSQTIHLFHYHNTYNWHEEHSAAEKAGLEKFLNWVRGSLGIENFTQARDLVLAGDFNLTPSQGSATLLHGLNFSNNWVDYVCGSMTISGQGCYQTSSVISDHNAVWAMLNAPLDIDAVVGPEVAIYNLAQGEYLYAADFAPYDSDRRRVFTWRPGSFISQGTWRLEPVSPGIVRIFNTYQSEYLYAADYALYDGDRRRVFTWRPGVPISQGNWQISGTAAQGVRFYNLKQGEYLYAEDYAPYDGDRRRVFTWVPGNPVRESYWRIE